MNPNLLVVGHQGDPDRDGILYSMEDEVYEKTDNKCRVEAREPRYAEPARKRGTCRVAGFSGVGPQLATIVALPLDLVLPTKPS